jgi:uncharacterized membrane protein
MLTRPAGRAILAIGFCCAVAATVLFAWHGNSSEFISAVITLVIATAAIAAVWRARR